MKNSVLVFTVFFWGSQAKRNDEEQRLEPEESRYLMRIINMTAWDRTGETHLKDLKWVLRDMKQYLTANIIIRKSYTINRMSFHFERCREHEFACEDFQAWNLSKFCIAMKMENQFWSSPLASIRPKCLLANCPIVLQGTYRMENASMDVNSVIQFYDEAPKYYWKVHVFVFNAEDEIEHQYHFHARFRIYTRWRGLSRSISALL